MIVPIIIIDPIVFNETKKEEAEKKFRKIEVEIPVSSRKKKKKIVIIESDDQTTLRS